ASPYNRRLKRLIDVAVALISIITLPIHLILVKRPFQFIANCFLVLFNRKTWIGYATIEKHLPTLKNCVLGCNGIPPGSSNTFSHASMNMVDYSYARDYEPVKDLKLLLKRYRMLGS